ncbi:MAG TPA: translesion DNA synthesis-associated protein ImuA [Burkholderiales bacterium]|nr:translesion DNA synthesis-associated protein ImuA [Burkholderiales bacterium]
MGSSALEAVLSHPAVWRGSECARVASTVPTGFAEIDAHLPGGGWPTGAITEIYPEHAGVGEMKLTLPAAARLTHEGRWIAVIAPPHVPYPPAFAAQGLRLERLVLIQPGSVEENLWAAEQALRATCCGAVLLWQDHVHERALRRLQLAAESASTTLFLFRSARVAPASPAALRLHVSRAQGRTIVRILKRRGGGLPPPIALDLHATSISRLRRPAPAHVREPLLALS